LQLSRLNVYFKKVVSLVGASAIFFGMQSTLAADNSNIWTNVQSAEIRIEKHRKETQTIEYMSYELASDICYLFEFKQKHNIPLEDYKWYDWRTYWDGLRTHLKIVNSENDPDLDKALMAVDTLSILALVKAFNPSGFDAKMIDNYNRVQSYFVAVKECSQRLGVDVYPIYQSLYATSVTTVEVAKPIVTLYAMISGAAFAMRWNAVRNFIARHYRSIAIISIGASAAYLTVEYLRFRTMQQELENYAHFVEVIENDFDSIILTEEDQWNHRRQLYFSTVQKLKEKLNTEVTESESFDLENLLGPELVDHLEYIEQNRDQMELKRVQLLNELGGAAYLESKIVFLKRKLSNGEPMSAEEMKIIKNSLFIGAIEYCLSMSAIFHASIEELNQHNEINNIPTI